MDTKLQNYRIQKTVKYIISTSHNGETQIHFLG